MDVAYSLEKEEDIMKYVITCPFCNNTFTVDGEQTKEFICPTCGGPANPDNAVSAHDTEMEEAQRKISVNLAVKKAMLEKEREEKMEAEKRESLALKNALIRGGICAGFIVLLSLSMVMCGK